MHRCDRCIAKNVPCVDDGHKSCKLCTSARKSCTFSGTREEVVPRGVNRARIEGQSGTRSAKALGKAKAKDKESEDESEESVQIVERTTRSTVAKAELSRKASKTFDQLADETGMRFGGLRVKGIEEVYGEQPTDDKAVFAKDAYINMQILRSAMDLGFDIMEQAAWNEIQETSKVSEWMRDARNVGLSEQFLLDAPGISKMREERLKSISGGKGYRSPVVASEDPEESGMSGKASVDLPTDPHAPIKKGIRLRLADLQELAKIKQTPRASGLKNVEGSPTKRARGLSSPEGTSRQKRAKSKEGWGRSKGVSAPVESEEESDESDESEYKDE
jgi:hypothetical protein